MHQFRCRIPSDLVGRVELKVALRVGDQVIHKTIGPKAREVTLSLRTSDPQEARTRQADVLSQLGKAWDAARQGPTDLNRKQSVALAGEIYRSWVETIEDNPGPPELWEETKAVNQLATEGGTWPSALFIGPQANKRRYAMEQRFGRFADHILAEHGLIISEGSRLQLIEDIAKAMDQAAGQLRRNADGDYRPDPDADRFPEFTPSASKITTPSLTFEDLLARRWREAKATGGSPRTFSAWKSAFNGLAEFLGHKDANRVTKDDIVRFKDHRLEQGVSVKTVNDSDLSNLKSTFGWAVSNGLMQTNPADGVIVKAGRSARRASTDRRSFTNDEALGLLRAAKLRKSRSNNERPKTTAAYRWVPWLLAFTGARVGEIAQLRKEDIAEIDGRWTIRITPDAGDVKSGVERVVPVHSQLIEDGFVEFVEASSPGNLFVSPKDPSNPSSIVRSLANRLQKEARLTLPDKDLQPNHGWRHRFTTICRELRCDDVVVRTIQGHSARDVHERYGEVTVAAMAHVIDALPRFDV